MKFSHLVPVLVTTVLAHSNSEHHHHHHDHHQDNLGAVCGSGALAPGGDSTCQPNADYIPGGQSDIFAEKPVESWKCPNGTDCDYAHKHSWTYETPCFAGKSGIEYCAITDTSFADGRGASFVMPLRRADYLATNPAFTEPDLVAKTNQDLVRTIPAKYDMQEFPGKGMGLVANQFIARGDLIMATTNCPTIASLSNST